MRSLPLIVVAYVSREARRVLARQSARQPGDSRQGANASPATGTIWLEPSNQWRANPSSGGVFRFSCPAPWPEPSRQGGTCLLYTSDAADERSSVDLGG